MGMPENLENLKKLSENYDNLVNYLPNFWISKVCNTFRYYELLERTQILSDESDGENLLWICESKKLVVLLLWNFLVKTLETL